VDPEVFLDRLAAALSALMPPTFKAEATPATDDWREVALSSGGLRNLTQDPSPVGGLV
jgi:hypothetical protein